MMPLSRTLRLTGQQWRQVDAEHGGDQTQVQDGQVALTALNRADERAVEVAPRAHFRLSPAVPLSVLADAVAESAQKFLISEVHT